MSFSFGTPSSAPASTGLTGFNFGANKPATPGFGLTATSQPSTGLFGGTPATSAPAFGTATPSFGASTTPAFGVSTPAFGTTSTPAFGATATPGFGATPQVGFGTSAAPSFGATTTPSFGTTGLGTGGLNFGAGTNTSTPNTGLSFGAPTASTASTGLGGFGFGTAATTTPQAGLGLFSNTSTTAGGLFVPMFPQNPGSPSVPITQTFHMIPQLQGSTPYHIVKPACKSFLELSPITDKPYQEKGRPDYHFIMPNHANKFGTTSAVGTLPSTTVTPSVGLGGVSSAVPGIGAASTATSGDGKSEPPKQIKLPNEITTMVDSFKDFVKKQKTISSEIMRVSVKPFHKVEREAEELVRAVLSLSGEVGKARAHCKRLRAAGAAALAAAETAARDPPNSEYEGTAPPSYVKELIAELEQQLIMFRRQMDVADKQMQSAPRLLSEQELNLGIRRMHESLVALAGRLQAVHAQVEAQKEQYLNLRKYVLKDQTNVFESKTAGTSLDQILRDAETSRKKSKLTGMDSFSLGSNVLSDPRTTLGNINQLAGPSPFSYVGTNIAPAPVAETPGTNWPSQPQNLSSSFNTSFGGFGAADANTTFQLQKPPGKRTKQ